MQELQTFCKTMFTQKMVATIHEGLDEEESQFKPNLGLVVNGI